MRYTSGALNVGRIFARHRMFRLFMGLVAVSSLAVSVNAKTTDESRATHSVDDEAGETPSTPQD